MSEPAKVCAMREIITVAADKPQNLAPGPAPMLQWIRIDRLVIDDRYQRDLKPGNWKAIRNIAQAFKWSRFSPVFCAPIEGGRYAIIDGQHRTHAAAMCGFDEVPCQIVQMTISEQAESFAAVNGAVTKVTSWNLFKAALSAGEPWAVDAARCAENAGCRLMTSNGSQESKKPGMIYAPAAFRKIVETCGAPKVTAALKVLMRAEGYGDTSQIFDISILGPLLMAMTKDAEFLARKDAHVMLERFDIWAAVDGLKAEKQRRTRLGLPVPSHREMLTNAITASIDGGSDHG